MLRTCLAVLCALPLSGCLNGGTAPRDSDTAATTSSAPSPIPSYQRSSAWYRSEAAAVAARDSGERARSIVLFIGDGMGVSTLTAARIYAGQQEGGSGEEYRLSFEAFPFTGLAKTYNVDAQTPDSAGTMSAIVTGVKTRIGMFGIDEEARQRDCESGQGRELLSILDIAELAGRATGIVTTARLTHATPAATYARSVDRDWEDDSAMPEEAIAAGCADIATQFVAHRERLNAEFGDGASDGIEVAFGGGRRHFAPADAGGARGDGADLLQRWQTLYPNGRYVSSKSELAALRTTPALGLFSDSHMDYELQRRDPGNPQPSLTAMTLKALDLLQRDGRDFLLVVEAGRIDHAHHAGNAANALNETAELADAVAAVMRESDPEATLVLVTADHSHVFSMAGYPRRGNPILGKVVPPWSDEPTLAADGMPYTTLGYMNGRGFRDLGEEPNADATYALEPSTGRYDISGVDTEAPGYHQEALIPTNAETHGGEDVAVYAQGPGAATASGNYEQNRLFHIMLNATGWERVAAARIERLRR